MQIIDDGASSNIILSLDYVKQYISRIFSYKQIKNVTEYSFTVGSNNRGEGLSLLHDLGDNFLYFGHLQLSVNPNNTALSPEKIEIKYRSYFNTKPYYKFITRFVEQENLINEASSSIELFDSLEVTQASTVYDFYLTFIGYKIDLS